MKNPPRTSRSVPLHPLLFAAYPVLFLFAANRREGVVLSDAWAPLGLAVGAAVVLVGVGWLLFRNVRAVALVVSAWALLFFSYGRVADALSETKVAGIDLGEDSPLLWIWAVAALGVVGLAYLVRRHLPGITNALNLIAVVLIAINVFSIASSGPIEVGRKTALADRATRPKTGTARPKHMPDIYYIVPEDYGVPYVHRKWFGIDTRWFYRYLKSKGFYVAWESMSNYQNTHQSLASSLNMEYLDKLFGDEAPSLHGTYDKLPNPKIARYLKSLGYRYVHIGSWYWPTAEDPGAHVNLNYGSISEFSSTLYETTVLPPVFRTFGVAQDKLDPRRVKWKRTLAEFDLAARARHFKGPKFVFSHIMFPHYQGPKPPAHTIDRNGNFITKEQEKERSYERLYGDQIIFAAKKLKQLIDSLLSDPGYQPVIILQTDEGPYRTEELEDNPAKFKWTEVSGDELRDHFLILNAYYLPGVSHDRLYPSITPVNSFRLVFNLYFRAGFRMLPDKFYAREINPTYHFVDVTKILRRELKEAQLKPP